ncbi:hypothetical protein ACIO6T_30800 [Streptomyces sp. NPDC087532]|uniref:hypothetical protein n=1 Tax=Streptomyces sp. NPDC087532 TaxID=3365795 RepID=UPI00380F4127
MPGPIGMIKVGRSLLKEVGQFGNAGILRHLPSTIAPQNDQSRACDARTARASTVTKFPAPAGP